MSNIDDPDTAVSAADNTEIIAQATGLIQPQKQIKLDIGLQSNYTDLPDIRGDVYTISIVADLNSICSTIPVPHQWNFDDGTGGLTSYEVDRWDHTAASMGSVQASTLIRNSLFNHHSTADTYGHVSGVLAGNAACHDEMDISSVITQAGSILPDVNTGYGQAAGVKGVMLVSDATGKMVPVNVTPPLFNEYGTDTGLLGGSIPSYAGTTDSQKQLGSLVGQVQEALINWFESANYEEATNIVANSGTVDPRKYDILRFWVNRGTDRTQNHLAKMKKDSVQNLIAKINANNKVDETQGTGASTLAYCCFDPDQIKQLFSTVELTGRVKTGQGPLVTDVSGNVPGSPGYEDTYSPVYGEPVPSSADGTGGNLFTPVGGKFAPRHFLDLKHGEGFAIVVPATAKLRSSTTTTTNLLVRVFQEHIP